jgi:hypothetical protein
MNEPNENEAYETGLEANEIEGREPDSSVQSLDEADNDEPNTGPTDEPLPVRQPEPNHRTGVGSATTLLLVFVVGLLIGYVARPFTDQLAEGSPPGSAPQSEAVAAGSDETATEPAVEDSASAESNETQPIAQAAADSNTGNDGSREGPMLITPTPDLSAAVAAQILPNVRHFIGDEGAPVTLIEFSDFQ